MKTEIWNNRPIRFVEVDGEWWVSSRDVAEAVGCEFTTDDLHGLLSTESVALHKFQNNECMFVVDRLGVYELLVKKSLGNQTGFMHWISKEMKASRNPSTVRADYDKGSLALSFATGLMFGLMLVFIF